MTNKPEMTNTKPWSIYVNRMNPGQKYLFANISIPAQWIQPGKVQSPADLAHLLDQWYAAWIELHLGKEQSTEGSP